MKIIKELFGTVNHQEVNAYTLENDNGVKITALDYGCTITKVYTPDRDGKIENIVLGYDTIEEYIDGTAFFGCAVGRVAGRIAGAEFMLGGKKYPLAKNENDNHIHGGKIGFNQRLWKTETNQDEDTVSVQFSYFSPDGEEGYPGNVEMKITYILNNDNEFTIHYEGTPDQTTILNVTNHSYFNLSGHLKTDVKNHYLTIKSDKYLELAEDLIPTGKFADVAGTPFDFNTPQQIRVGVESSHAQNVLAGGGYDHPFVLRENNNKEVVIEDRENGRTLTVETDQPGIVIYTANQLADEGEIYGVQARKHLAVCLETQGLPNSINEPQFPSWVVKKDETFSSKTKFIFGVR